MAVPKNNNVQRVAFNFQAGLSSYLVQLDFTWQPRINHVDKLERMFLEASTSQDNHLRVIRVQPALDKEGIPAYIIDMTRSTLPLDGPILIVLESVKEDYHACHGLTRT